MVCKGSCIGNLVLTLLVTGGGGTLKRLNLVGGPEVVWGLHTWVELQVPDLLLAPSSLWLLIFSLQGILIVTGQAKGLSLKLQTIH